MAAVDSLLEIAREQRADVLILTSGEPPILLSHGIERKLTMPSLDDILLRTFVAEINDGAIIEIGATEIEHECRAGRFIAKITATKNKLRVAFVDASGAAAFGSAVSPPPNLATRYPAAVPVRQKSTPIEGSGDASRAKPQARATSQGNPTRTEVGSLTDLAHGRLLGALAAAHDAGGSDVLVSANEPIRVRTGGVLRISDPNPTDEGEINSLVEAAGSEQRTVLRAAGSVDFALEFEGGERFRINVFRHRKGLALAARPIRPEAPTLRSLRLPAQLKELVEYESGLVLVAGATGSGKSTTVVALVEQLNRHSQKHIITLEDPIEYCYQSRRSLVHQREIGADVATFAEGLRSALRENPDVIVLGEMRDPQTIRAALTAAELGHLVISTIHSRGAAWAVSRIVDGMPSDVRALVAAQLSGSLRAVLTQVLVPDTRGGRVVAHELLLNNAAIASKLREGNFHQVTSLIETSRAQGMRLLEDSLAELVRRGEIEMCDAIAVSSRPKILEELVRC